MVDPKIAKYILDRLSAHATPDQITYSLCEKYGLRWDEAYSMVFYVKTEQAQEITKRQFPMMLGAALFTFIGGVGAIAWSIVELNNYASLLLAEGALTGMSANILMLLIETVPGYFGLIGMGLAMIVGSIIGMRHEWSKLLFGE
ncbi:MAG: hypothetical protein ACOYY3_19795 [Chloroflexota bacterium]